MQTARDIDLETDPKRIRVLKGAMQVFLAYGYSRTTMDDIARAAEVSRPALYLLFRNKTDIYRAICSCLLCNSVREARQALHDREKFLEESETRLFEKVQQQQEKESELEQREENLGVRAAAVANGAKRPYDEFRE